MVARRLALASIDAYQRYVSPYKGFCCARRAHTGAPSCSTLGYRAIRRYGVLRDIGVLRWQFAECGSSFQRHHSSTPSPRRQRGSCDVPCDIPCDGQGLSCACDCCSCDGGSDRSRPKQKQESQDNAKV
jgi:putative component of membrane protein insertase Oxa1/YidC/SpoIIIJ protein YidD